MRKSAHKRESSSRLYYIIHSLLRQGREREHEPAAHGLGNDGPVIRVKGGEEVECAPDVGAGLRRHLTVRASKEARYVAYLLQVGGAVAQQFTNDLLSHRRQASFEAPRRLVRAFCG